jgi:hypothetical protein
MQDLASADPIDTKRLLNPGNNQLSLAFKFFLGALPHSGPDFEIRLRIGVDEPSPPSYACLF